MTSCQSDKAGRKTAQAAGQGVAWDWTYSGTLGMATISCASLLFWTQGKWEVERTEAGDNQLELLSVWCSWSLPSMASPPKRKSVRRPRCQEQ
jgi:hypothetical protein